MSAALQPVVQPVRDAAAEPVVKWAGGKTQLLSQLQPLLPERFGRYFEPFVGGAAVFLRLQPQDAVLADINAELVALYMTIRDDVEALITDLRKHRYERTYYYAMRAADPAGMSRIQRASRMLYLNRTCFNGLYRVNRSGQFNVPIGRYKNPRICDAPRLRAVSRALAGADVRNVDFAEATAGAQAGDFVYFDPPYFPLTRTANFTSYTRDAFGPDEQRRLAAVFADLTARDVKCVQSNSDTPFIRALYADYEIATVSARRAISRNARTRGPVNEVVIRNFR